MRWRPVQAEGGVTAETETEGEKAEGGEVSSGRQCCDCRGESGQQDRVQSRGQVKKGLKSSYWSQSWYSLSSKVSCIGL